VAENRELPELIDTLRWRWKTAALLTAAFFAGTFLYAESLPPAFDGEAVVAFAPRAGVDADTVRVVLPSYVRFVVAPETVRRVAEQLDEDRDELQSAVDAEVPQDTGNLIITVRSPTPERAAAAANAFAEEALSRARGDELIDGELVAEALPPREPAAPPRRLLEAAGLVVGLILGLTVGFILERGRPRVRSWRDLARATGYPVIGRVPASRALRTRPTHAFAEPVIGAAFRTLRTNLELELRDHTIDVIIVTSPTPGDGKTTIAALVAESLARLGAHVLLVDADLRRPGVARTFRLAHRSGTREVLRQTASLAEALQPGWTDGLTVLPTRPDPDAGDLIARRFDGMIREAREHYDVVVVDTPPLLGTDDARTIVTMGSGVLLVVQVGAMAGPVNEAVLVLEGLKAKVLGVVGNRLRESRETYYYSTSTG